jgi:hypothetical protein
MVAAVALSSCRSTTMYIPVETVKYDSIYTTKYSIDTIVQKDSVLVLQRNDTVFVEKYKTLLKVKKNVDTVYIERRDSISVPYPVTQSLTKWQQTKMDLGGMAMGALVVAIIAFVIYIIIRTRNSKK